MSETVEPALTPEEWAALPAPIKRPGTDGAQYVKLAPTFCVEGFSEMDEDGRIYDDCDCGEVGLANPEARHALAALALHGQPFGFTREDVQLLRDLDAATIGMTGGDNGDIASLAARIEALLPPEAK